MIGNSIETRSKKNFYLPPPPSRCFSSVVSSDTITYTQHAGIGSWRGKPLCIVRRTFRDLFVFLHYANCLRAFQRSFFCESTLNNRSRIRKRSARNARADCTMRSRLASWEMERCKLCVNSNSGLKCRKCSRFICEKFVRVPAVQPACLTNAVSRQKYSLVKCNLSKLISTYKNTLNRINFSDWV